MKKIFSQTPLFVILIGLLFPSNVIAASYTHSFTKTTNLTYTSSIDTHIMSPACDGVSPASYTWSLSVNGVSISGTKTCTTPPVVNIYFSSIIKMFKGFFTENTFALAGK
ncbi:MAG: hypothetical protein WCT07_00140 [Candidatus Paceibacterota bacterium]|jgi:hypothetical protein